MYFLFVKKKKVNTLKNKLSISFRNADDQYDIDGLINKKTIVIPKKTFSSFRGNLSLK